MQEVGTYHESFISVIETLAAVMEQRDRAVEQYELLGGETTVSHVNKFGAVNVTKNPALVIVDDLNKTALAYWRDLGLTPAGLKRINDQAMKGGAVSGFAEIVGKIFTEEDESK